ncbi:MAG: hypothetical protein KBC42_00560 [Candidatus Pacebacteria bacterium]|nr:hypothetical protein [Candidatus Paceibacterota bacterium]MBP9780399.1 hypothetical protein [Candidatus Paceibacterota bacterium]
MKKDFSIRNFWSLNTDETVTIGLLQRNTNRDIEVFMPMNSQMKDIDLIIANTRNQKMLTLQVKASKAYIPSPAQNKRFGNGSGTFVSIKANSLEKSNADYFVFTLYGMSSSDKNFKGKISVQPYILIISTRELIKKINSYKRKSNSGSYIFHFWINADKNEIFDWRDLKDKNSYGYYSEFLDDLGLKNLIRHLS